MKIIAILALAAVLMSAYLVLQQRGRSAGNALSGEYNATELYQEALQCSGNSRCIYEELGNATKENGPAAALDVLGMLISKNAFSGDDHQAAHEIGRKTAEYFGFGGDSFLLCTTAFNYGCQHGFFEHVLGRSKSANDAISMICGSIEKNSSYPSKFKFYCYHGVGHGVMMANAYNLNASLIICDSLETQTAIDGCWQGVFMENVNGGMKNESMQGIFSGDDPLRPCNAVENKYRYQCFVNHAGWLMHVFGDIEKASVACLGALNHTSTCLHSLGLMASNPSWNKLINSALMAREEAAWEFCRKFPVNQTEHCVTGAVANIMNFDELNVTGAKRFCDLTGEYGNLCAAWVGRSLRSQTLDNNVVADKCAELTASSDCLKAAGLR